MRINVFIPFVYQFNADGSKMYNISDYKHTFRPMLSIMWALPAINFASIQVREYTTFFYQSDIQQIHALICRTIWLKFLGLDSCEKNQVHLHSLSCVKRPSPSRDFTASVSSVNKIKDLIIRHETKHSPNPSHASSISPSTSCSVLKPLMSKHSTDFFEPCIVHKVV